jgi:N-acetyltransferase
MNIVTLSRNTNPYSFTKISNMKFSIQPNLQNNKVHIRPLDVHDFDVLFQAASDRLVWEQHPNPNRYQLKEFTNYFEGAIKSKGALLVTDVETNEVIGSSRYYDYNENEDSILIGYTFIKRTHWGKGYNAALKSLMLNYIYQFVNKVHFHIGGNNIRSQKAMEHLGGKKTGELNVAYYNEPGTLNYVYSITKEDWKRLAPSFI